MTGDVGYLPQGLILDTGQTVASMLGIAALIIASHDLPFLRSIGITRWLRLDRRARVSD